MVNHCCICGLLLRNLIKCRNQMEPPLVFAFARPRQQWPGLWEDTERDKKYAYVFTKKIRSTTLYYITSLVWTRMTIIEEERLLQTVKVPSQPSDGRAQLSARFDEKNRVPRCRLGWGRIRRARDASSNFRIISHFRWKMTSLLFVAVANF